MNTETLVIRASCKIAHHVVLNGRKTQHIVVLLRHSRNFTRGSLVNLLITPIWIVFLGFVWIGIYSVVTNNRLEFPVKAALFSLPAYLLKIKPRPEDVELVERLRLKTN